MLNLRAVDTVREVAARGSFSAAAQALHLTQPAVSRQVAQLEREVGVQLVVRSRRGVRLTPAGERVLAHADAIRARLGRLETELAELAVGERVVARIGGFPTAFVGLVPALVGRLGDHPAAVDVTLRRCGHDEAAALVRAGELDLAFAFARTGHAEDADEVLAVDLGEEPMLALLPRAHALVAGEPIDLAALAGERWIVGAPDRASSVIVDACRTAGFEPEVAFETDDALATQSLVAAGFGVSLSSRWLAAALRDDVVLRPLAPPTPTRDVVALVPHPETRTSRLLLDLARDAFSTAAA